jgi:hypothetical protein
LVLRLLQGEVALEARDLDPEGRPNLQEDRVGPVLDALLPGD